VRLLVTGFEPFDERGYNTSSDVLPLLPDTVGETRLVTGVLPVDWRSTGPALTALLDRHRPDVAIALGMSRDPFLGLERIATNFQTASRPDNRGAGPLRERIVEDAPAAYWSGLDLDAARDVLDGAGFDARISGSAGAYLCNLAFFTLAHHGACGSSPQRAGFVHVPPLPSDGGWPLERTARALAAMFQEVAGGSVES